MPIVHRAAFCAAIALAATSLPAQQPATPRPLDATTVFDTTLAGGAVHEYLLSIPRGGSASLVVTQMGVDVVVDVRAADGTLVGTFDSPNGREGDEPVEVFSVAGGPYVAAIHGFAGDTDAGRYRLRVVAVRDSAATAVLLAARRAARDSAAAWLRPRSVAIAADGSLPAGPLAPLDRLAARARVLGLGEATHGSREFGDFRLALTRRLVERAGYRVVALEASAEDPTGGDGWIGVRTRGELARWVRRWNAVHPRDTVTVVGVDPQGSAAPLRRLGGFVARAYGAAAAARWEPVVRELLAADSQVVVFGDSYVSPPSRQVLLELVARLELDAPLLRARLGAAVDSARGDARLLSEFADFNGDGGGPLGARSRDWYMAARILDALRRAGPRARAVYWAHNAHVAAPAGRPIDRRTAGALLRDALGCRYAAVAQSFGQGSFVAQVPNDPDDRLVVSALPAPVDESVDQVLASLRPGASAAAWGCDTPPAAVPRWLREPRAMHWVGGLYTPGTLPAAATRPFELLHDFDAIAWFPRVTAEELPPPCPRIPARVR